jgi:hypothetical protein
MRVMPPSHTRFDRLPAWQRAATLTLTVLAICIVLLLLAEIGVRIRNKLLHGDFWGIEETYTLDSSSGLRIPIPGGRFGPISINSFGFRGPEISEDNPANRLRIVRGEETIPADAKHYADSVHFTDAAASRWPIESPKS